MFASDYVLLYGHNLQSYIMEKFEDFMETNIEEMEFYVM